MAQRVSIPTAGGTFGDRLSTLGQHWAQQWQEQATRTSQVIQGSAAAQAIQEAATRQCKVCQQRSLRGNIFQCSECSGYCCRNCCTVVRLYNPTGESSLAAPGPRKSVCKACYDQVLERCRAENVRERLKRVAAFFDGNLEPYRYSAETKLEKSYRLGAHVAEGVRKVSGFLPLAGEAIYAIEAGYYIIRYGPLVLAGNEVLLALQLIINLANKLHLPNFISTPPQELFGGLYYMMGENCGERGRMPELEHLEHVQQGGDVPEPPAELMARLLQTVRLIYITAYTEKTPTDIQRMLHQVLPGSELVLAEMSVATETPSYFLACTRRTKEAYVVLPGTKSAADIVTDFNAEQEEFIGGHAHRGMLQSARWLCGELLPVLQQLHGRGFQTTIIGHSLGAAVGALFVAMVRPHVPNAYCYGFGTPPCVDEKLMPQFLDCMTSVVNRDDMVPRLTLQAVEELFASVTCAGQVAKTRSWMAEDWNAVQNVEKLVELKRRQAPAPEGAGIEEEKIVRLCEAGVPRATAERVLQSESWDLPRAMLRATEEEHNGNSETAGTAGAASTSQPSAPPVQQVGPSASQAWEAGLRHFEDSSKKLFGDLQRFGASAHSQLQAWSATPGSSNLPKRREAREFPRYEIPGQLVHLYQRNGLGRAALADSGHPTFSRISLSPRMVQDHMLKEYYAAVRQACIQAPRTPRWETFDERPVCACCGSDFNWACILRSEPQRMLARHHCYSCGRVVCSGCSGSVEAHPRLGLSEPVRTCDSCLFNFDGEGELRC